MKINIIEYQLNNKKHLGYSQVNEGIFNGLEVDDSVVEELKTSTLEEVHNILNNILYNTHKIRLGKKLTDI